MKSTYEIVSFATGYSICRKDPDSNWPLWLEHIYRGEITWYTDHTYARHYTKRTAQKLLKALQTAEANV